VRALGFIPLVSHGALIGTFTIYADAPHAFTGDELDLAQVLARQLAFALERMNADADLRHQREVLQAIIDRIPVMIVLYRPDPRALRLNPEFERITGWTSAAAAGRSLMEDCFPDPDLRAEAARFMQTCQDGWMDMPMRARDGRDIQASWANIR